MKKIYFIGDSFTWGEGLELYMEIPIYQKLRKKHATDIELQKVSNNYTNLEVESFRVSKRFASYVKGFDVVVQPDNGGTYDRLYESIDEIEKEHNPNIYIIQLPPIDRAKWYSNAIDMNSSNPLQILSRYAKKDSKLQKKWLDRLNITYEDFYTGERSKVDKKLNELSYRNYMLFYYSFIWDLVVFNKKKVFLIGPHQKPDSIVFKEVCNDNKQIKDMLIPIEYNGEIYYDFRELGIAMDNNGDYSTIDTEFRNTHNNHPTPLQHKIVGRAVNKFLYDYR